MDVDVAIIGAGHNGLVAAAYLAKSGLQVHLFERRAFVGGACVTEELWPGFQFSTCAHTIHSFPPRIIKDLGLEARGFQMLPREGYIRMRPDGTYYGPSGHASPANRAAEGRLSNAEREEMRAYGAFKRTLHDTFVPYRFGPPPSLDEVRRDVKGSEAADVLETALTRRISQVQADHLSTEALMDWHAGEGAAVGRDPLALHFAYASINAPDPDTGVAHPYGYVKGGMGALSDILAEAVRDAGAKLHLESPVDRILVEGGRPTGLRTADGTEVSARVVVSNLDPKATFLKLMPEGTVDQGMCARLRALITEVSCTKLLAVIDEPPQWKYWDGDPDQPYRGAVTLHSSRPEISAAYDDLEAGRPPAAPVVSFSMPSFADPGLTQPGSHTASVWIYPAPARLSEGTWDGVRDRVAEGIIDRITDYAPNFKGSIRNYLYRTPADLERDNGLTDGCIWHVQHAGEHLFWNRPLPELSRYRAPHPGLYLCGAGQHPGGEVSGIPGHNAAKEILKDLG